MGCIKNNWLRWAIMSCLAWLTAIVYLGWTAINPAAAVALTPEQSNAIVQNCSGIKQSLAKLQVIDSRTRTYLGSSYEAIAGRFITPLNLRLVKNGLPSEELFRIQNDFTAAQTAFRNGYVDYMREMDALVATDCVLHPQEFYNQLETVRARRETLRTTTKKLMDLAEAQYKTVTDLRATLQ